MDTLIVVYDAGTVINGVARWINREEPIVHARYLAGEPAELHYKQKM